eukprot:TRINITY_DN10153_c0_g1_i2.p1 TRINITY_DN10153_c0_g1~~TRINITY_DN10153_c0_g1_i2.p1  ORF type:complete len:981 (+),score=164.11 TRINITY_DN10153_c0_g1_i2:46-2988(+)
MEYFEATRIGDEYAVIPSPPPPPAVSERVAATPSSTRLKRVWTPDHTPKKHVGTIDNLHKQLRAIIEGARMNMSNLTPSMVEGYLKALSQGVAIACTQKPPSYNLARDVLKTTEATLAADGVLGNLLQEPDRLRMCALYYSTCAVFCKHIDECEEAARYCTRALRLFRSLSESLPTDVAVAELNLSAVLGRLKRHKLAADHARSAIVTLTGHPDTGPMAAVAHYNLAVELQYCKQHTEAREVLGHALNLSKKYLSPSEPIAMAIAALYTNNVKQRPPTLANVKAISKSSPVSEAASPAGGTTPGQALVTPTPTMGSAITTLSFPNSASPREATDVFGCWDSPDRSIAAGGSSFLPPIGSGPDQPGPVAVAVPHPPQAGASSHRKKSSRRRPSSPNSERKPSRKASQPQMVLRNVIMSKNLYAQSFKRTQKHLAVLTAGINKERKRREAAAVTIQCAMRKCKANLELYNRKQLLYQCMHEKHSYITNLIKGKIRCWRAQRWLAERKEEIKNANDRRADEEREQDAAATRIARYWKSYSAKENKALKDRVFEQAVMETRMKKLSQKCLNIQRWWRWVRLIKNYWRRRGRQVAIDIENRKQFERAEKSAIKLQSVWRGCLGLREAKHLRQRLEKQHTTRLKQMPYATEIVKYVLKSCIIKKRREKEQSAPPVSLIVETWKAQSAIKEDNDNQYKKWKLDKEITAAETIQRMYRSHRGRAKTNVARALNHTLLRNQQNVEAQKDWNAVAIQCWWRTMSAKRSLQERKATLGRTMIEAIWKLQRWYRGIFDKRLLLVKKEQRRTTLANMKETLETEEDSAARRLQCAWVMCLARRRFRVRRAEHQACKEIAQRLAAVDLVKYDIAVLLQRIGKGHLGRLDLRMYGLSANFAAKCIQLTWKAYKSRKIFRSKKAFYETRLQEMSLRKQVVRSLFQDSFPELLDLEASERALEVEEEYIARVHLFRYMHGEYDADDEVCSSTSGCYD